MSTRVLICDDSSMAHKQLARALPPEWDVSLEFAADGAEALGMLQRSGFDVLFLDLNMPVMDGYQVLAEIQARDVPVIVIVVSGDIQPDAVARTRKLGAYEFIGKPVDTERLREIQLAYGLFAERESAAGGALAHYDAPSPQGFDVLREAANVAMGRAADLLARLLNVFVSLPVPKVNLLEVSELQMALSLADRQDTFSAVCQGMIGEGVVGEALLIFHDSSYAEVMKLLGYQGELSETMEAELIMDLASILIGAFSRGLADQLDMSFSQGSPVILGRHVNIEGLLHSNQQRWKKTLAIEICYGIEHHDIHCDLLLLFTEASLPILLNKARYLAEG